MGEITNNSRRMTHTGDDIMNKDIFSANAQAAMVTATPVVTSIATSAKFHLPGITPAPQHSASAAGAETISTEAQRQQVAGVTADYMATDAMIKATAIEAMRDVVGADMADRMSVQLMDGGHVSKIQAAAQILDPTGIGGSIYAVLNAIHSEMKGYDDAKINEVMELTLNRLREAASPEGQAHLRMDNQQILKIPEGLDFENVNWAELRAFFERNPENDPIMREARNIEIALDATDENNSYIEGHYHRTGSMEDKALLAGPAAAGEFIGNDEELAAIVYGDDDLIPAGIATTCSESLNCVQGVSTDSETAANVESEATETIAASLHNEPPPELVKSLSDEPSRMG